MGNFAVELALEEVEVAIRCHSDEPFGVITSAREKGIDAWMTIEGCEAEVERLSLSDLACFCLSYFQYTIECENKQGEILWFVSKTCSLISVFDRELDAKSF